MKKIKICSAEKFNPAFLQHDGTLIINILKKLAHIPGGLPRNLINIFYLFFNLFLTQKLAAISKTSSQVVKCILNCTFTIAFKTAR